MKIWLDDVRPAPEGWRWCKTVDEVKLLMFFESESVTEMSLDHDLGEGQPTGYDLCKWMAAENIWPTKSVGIHSMNPVGRNNMNAIIQRYFIGIEPY